MLKHLQNIGFLCKQIFHISLLLSFFRVNGNAEIILNNQWKIELGMDLWNWFRCDVWTHSYESESSKWRSSEYDIKGPPLHHIYLLAFHRVLCSLCMRAKTCLCEKKLYSSSYSSFLVGCVDVSSINSNHFISVLPSS